MSEQTIDIDDWQAVADAFRHMFAGLGAIVEDPTGIRFLAEETGLDLGRDGTSRSFMPLHESRLRWDTITFDEAEREVLLTDGCSTYLYRIPSNLATSDEPLRGPAQA
ncbi:MAG: hypothetical protein ACR2N2_10330 [Acidimicrobiia bacterium]